MKKAIPYIILATLAIAAIGLRNCKSSEQPTKNKTKTTEKVVTATRGLNRNPSAINYSKHAKCRMQCRQISVAEVIDILKNGNINYKKSNLKGNECAKRYAVEGISKDNQKLRIIFAPCNTEITVVTCIDLSKDWDCTCEGDE